MKEYGFDDCAEHSAIIYEKGTEAETESSLCGDEAGVIISTTEWATITEDNGKRICAALKYFSETSTDDIEKLAKERFE